METLFITATKKRFRFGSIVGPLTIEDLWDLPLTAGNKPNLNDIAIKLDDDIEKTATKSFVTKTPVANKTTKMKLDIVKYIISVKLEEKDAAKVLKAKKERKEKILELLAQKRDEADTKRSEEDLVKELAELSEV